MNHSPHSLDALIGLAALEAAVAKGDLADHRRLLLALAVVLPPDSREAAVAEALAAALQLDLAFLRSYPGELVPTLLWRCSPPDGNDAGRGPLADLVQRWREECSSRQARIAKMHALTPPRHAPRGPLIAELRTADPHDLLSPMTVPGHVVLKVQADAPGGALRHWLVAEGTLASAPEIVVSEPPLKFVFSPWESAALKDASSGAHHCQLPIPEGGNASEGTFSPDGTRCAVAGSGDEYSFGFVHLYDTKTGQTLREWHAPRPFWSRPVFSPDGLRVSAPSDAGLFLWDVASGQEECLPIHDAKSVAFSQGGRWLVTTNRRTVQVWDLARLRAKEPSPAEPSEPMVFSPDGQRLVLGDWLCDGATGRRLRKLKIPRGRYLMGGPPRRWFTCGTEQIVSLECGVHVWDADDGHDLWHRSDPHYAHWHVTAFSADGRSYVVAHEGTPTAQVRDARTDRVLASVETAGTGLSCLALSPDGQWLAGGTDGGEVELWKMTSGQHLLTLHAHDRPVSDVAFSLDSRRLASAGDDEALRIWEVPSGAERAARRLDQRDPCYTRWQGGVTSEHRCWSATPDSLRALSGWGGFVGPLAGPCSVEERGGVTIFTNRATGQVAGVFPLEGPWLLHPDGVTWASPFAHVIFEDQSRAAREP